MTLIQTVFVLTLATMTLGQRPPFAGSRPIGFPDLANRTTTTTDALDNKFGEDVTTERLPIEALGDRDLIDRISKLPIDQQPFWYLNWKALEEQRKNPQTFAQRPSQFSERFPDTGSNSNGNPTNNIPNGGVENRNFENNSANSHSASENRS